MKVSDEISDLLLLLSQEVHNPCLHFLNTFLNWSVGSCHAQHMFSTLLSLRSGGWARRTLTEGMNILADISRTLLYYAFKTNYLHLYPVLESRLPVRTVVLLRSIGQLSGLLYHLASVWRSFNHITPTISLKECIKRCQKTVPLTTFIFGGTVVQRRLFTPHTALCFYTY